MGSVTDMFGEVLSLLGRLVLGQVVGGDTHGGFALQEGDHDPAPALGRSARYAGISHPGLAGTSHVRDLHRDLREVGIALVRAEATEFGRETRWAIRELQTYARGETLARERRPVQTVLANAVSAVATSIEVDESGGLPATVPYRIRIGHEVLEVTAAANTTLAVTRAVEGSAGAGHAAGAVVSLTRWAARLDAVAVPVADRFTGPISGVLDAATRRTLARWKAELWRCPVVVEAWEGIGTPQRRIATSPPASGLPARPADNLWLHDEITYAPRVYVRDLRGDPDRPAARAADDGPTPARMSVLASRLPFNANDPVVADRWSGPGTLAPAHTWSPEGEILPEALIGPGRTLAALAADAAVGRRATLSTFKVVRAVSEVETVGYFDGLNAHDNAFLSLGPCHWTAGQRTLPPLPPPPWPARALWSVAAGELWGFLAYLRSVDAAAFDRVATDNGLGVIPAWGVNGAATYNGDLRKYEGRATLARADGTFAEPTGVPGAYGQLGEYELFRTWHWFHRLQRAARTLPGFRRAMWPMARVRVRDLLASPWDPPNVPPTVPDVPATSVAPSRRVRVGDIYTSELAVALLVRWHIYRPADVLRKGRAAQRLHQALVAAQAAPGAPLVWNASPTAWSGAHEDRLIQALRQGHDAELTRTMTQVAAWPDTGTPAAWAGRSYTLPVVADLTPPERTLRRDRGSFALDDAGLPPQQP